MKSYNEAIADWRARRRYVRRGAATREAIRQLNEAREQKNADSKSTKDEQAS